MTTLRWVFTMMLGFFLYKSSHLMAQPAPSFSPVQSVYLPGMLGTFYIIAYLPGRALPTDCLDAWVQNKPAKHPNEASFESSFVCVRKTFFGTKSKVQTNLVRVAKAVEHGTQWNEIPIEGRLEMDPGAPIRWFKGWVDYWILEANPTDLSTKDAYFVAGGPKKTVLAIFSRQPSMDEITYQKILRHFEGLGYAQLSERIIRFRR